MPLLLTTIPCLKDNYAFLLHDTDSGDTALVDAPEAAPIMAALRDNGWTLSQILLTHHHSDHVAGAEEIAATTGARILGAASDAHRLPPLQTALNEGDAVQVGSEIGTVMAVPGHTIGHIAFHFPDSKYVFTGDSLMAGGCGRLFEGTPKLMWGTLSKLAALPPETLVCSGHEYTANNLLFAASVDLDNEDLVGRIEATSAAVQQGIPTVPSLLSLELATNPFLRAGNRVIATTIGMPDASAAEVFTALRKRKDKF
ncbi:MAG: hydroxyacylglutathione hydrolase [Pseudomonadota bacterium]